MDEQGTETVAPKASLLAKLKNVSKKTKIIIAAGVALLLGGGSAFAYSALQSPEAVVGLALASAFTGAHPSGNLDVNAAGAALNGDASMDIYTADSGSGLKLTVTATLAGQPVGATLSAVTAKNGDVYINLANFDSLGKYLVSSATLDAASEAFYARTINGIWFKITKSEISQFTGGSDCISKKLDNPAYTTQLGSEMQGALRSNLFIVPTKELPGVNGDRVFRLGISVEKLKGFVKAVTKTQYYRDIQSCLPGFNFDTTQIDSITQTQMDDSLRQSGIAVTLYAKGGWSPSMDKLVITSDIGGTEKLTATYTPGGDQSKRFVIPKKSESITQLITMVIGSAF